MLLRLLARCASSFVLSKVAQVPRGFMGQNRLYHICVYKSLGTSCHFLNITNIYTTVLKRIAFLLQQLLCNLSVIMISVMDVLPRVCVFV